MRCRFSIKKLVLLLCSLINFNVAANTMSNLPSNDTVAQFQTLVNNYEKDLFNYSPELALFWGKSDVPQNKFMDHSLFALEQWHEKENNYAIALKKINPEFLRNTQWYVTYRLFKESLENSRETRVCKDWFWNVSPTLNGWPMQLVQVAEKQPISTDNDKKVALQRWNTFGAIVTDEIANLKRGLDSGYSAPKVAVEAVLSQLSIILDSKPEDSPYYVLASRDKDPVFRDNVVKLIETVIHPGLQQYRDFLENEYLPFARDEVGVSALPAGNACYRAKIKNEVTLDAEPTEIYAYGLRHMEELKKEVAAIGIKLFGEQDMAKVFMLSKTHAKYLFHSEEEILNYNKAALERAKAKLSLWFEDIPTIEAIIKPYPEFRAKTGASGEYSPPSEDGTEPGIYYINTYQPTSKSRVDQEATVFHELIPGHHFQIALTFENKSLYHLNKYFWNSGYGEGWALYVERLADEMGLYSDDIARLGMLSNEALRTARLVVDPGMHVMHWTRDQAVQYLREHTALSEGIIQGEVNRYIMLPGQATAYMLGKHVIEELRNMAKNAFKDKFDIRSFHHHVLKNGAVNLTLLQEQINRWVHAHTTPSPAVSDRN